MSRLVTDGGSDGSQDGGNGDGGNGDGGNGSNGSGDGGKGTNGTGNDATHQQGTSTVEKGAMAVSVLFTVLLFTFAGWQIVTPAVADVPEATVVGTEPTANGSVAVTVRLDNPADAGFVSVTVQSDCAAPPPEVQFSYVPAASDRTGTLVCPAGTTDPSVSVASWVRR